jgi:cyclohexanecarboxylate-CoA ligase
MTGGSVRSTRLDANLVAEYAACGARSDRTLVDHLRAATRAHPNRIAAVALGSDGSRRALSYAELDELSDRLAGGLAGAGVAAGNTVCVMLPNGLEFSVTIWAILKLGAVFSGIPSSYGVNEAAFMVRRARAKVLVIPDRIGRRDYLELARATRDAAPDLETVAVVGDAPSEPGWTTWAALAASPMLPARPVDPASLAHIGFTSGTTGEPKGVMNTHQTLDRVMEGWIDHVGEKTFGQPMVNFVPSPVGHHTGFLWGVLLTARLAGTAVYVDRWLPAQAAGQMRAEDVTFLIGAPTFLQDLMAARAETTPETLRMIAIAGAPIPRSLVPAARERFACFICPAWGMTEHGLGASASPSDPPDLVDETDGTMIGDCRLRTTSQGVPAEPGVEGDLEMSGPGLFLGYFDRPDFTAESFDGEWFKTGDRAVITAEGHVILRGRTKDIIIRGGENIPVVDIETMIHRHPAVLDVAVVGVPDARLGERAAAVLVLEDGVDQLSLPDLTTFLLGHGLSKHFLPERVESVDALPKTAGGKIKKNELRTWLEARG